MKIKLISGLVLGLSIVALVADPAKSHLNFSVAGDRDNLVISDKQTTAREFRADRSRYERSDRDRREIENRITQLYLNVLGRRPDRGGLRNYRDLVINDRWSYPRVRQSLARSKEARQKIVGLCQEVLRGRFDRNCLQDSQNALERGLTLREIRRNLERSRRNRR